MDSFQDFQITHKILKQISKISFYRERFSSLPIEKKWQDQISDAAIMRSSICSLSLDNQDIEVNCEADIADIKNATLRQRLSNDIELRKSFPIYFNTNEFNPEQISYIHRFIDNVFDKDSNNRGQYRKSQDVAETIQFKKLSSVLPRYGFLPRLTEEFVREINESYVEEILLSGLIYAEFISLSPFSRSNAQVARLLSKGYLFVNRFDKYNFLNIEAFFIEKKDQYYHSINRYLEGDPGPWIDIYLRSVIAAFKEASIEIERVSGNTIRPLANEIIQLTKRQKTIVELLKKNGQMSGSEIAAILGVTRQNIFVIMQKLLGKKVVGKIGKGTASRYRLRVEK